MATETAKLIYSGPVPPRPADYYALTGRSGHAYGFVYTLWNGAEPLYVGMSYTPGQRFDRHRRKFWWRRVDWLELHVFHGDDRRSVRVAMLAAEPQAIRELRPTHNIAGRA